MEKESDLYVTFIDLDKAYNGVDRDAFWKVLLMYGVYGKVLNTVRGFYRESKACV